MRIIALTGPANCGKTTTLNLLWDQVTRAGAVSSGKVPLGAGFPDFSDVVTYNGKKIAFYTMGDYSGLLVSAIRNYHALGMDVLVCACNNKFVRPFREIAKYPNHLHPKTPASTSLTESAANTADANTLFSLI